MIAPPNRGGSVLGTRALSPDQIRMLIYLRGIGWTADQMAAEFGVSRRTIYRWMDARIVPVTVEGWTALFAIRTGAAGWREGPFQLEGWRVA